MSFSNSVRSLFSFKLSVEIETKGEEGDGYKLNVINAVLILQ